MDTKDQDRIWIQEKGGPTKVAKILGYKKGGAQRVQNWLSRGIPAEVKVEHPELFFQQPKRQPHKNSN